MSDVPLIPRRWNDVDISGIEGKKFFITGGTSGLGKESAAALIRRGAHVTITARSEQKGAAMVAELGGKNIDSNVQLLRSECNYKKAAKHPIDYMQSKGMLL